MIFQKNKTPERKGRIFFVLALVAMCTALGAALLLPADVAHAGAPATDPTELGTITIQGIADAVGSAFSGAQEWIVYQLLSWFNQLLYLVLGLLTAILNWVTYAATSYALYDNIIQAPIVTTGWNTVVLYANLFFVAFLLIIAFATILDIEEYNYRRLLWKLIIAALLINFSKVIAGVFIDAAGVITRTFAEAAGGTNIGDMIWSRLGVFRIYNFAKVGDAAVQLKCANDIACAYQQFLSLGMSIIISLIAIFCMGALAFMFLIRIIALWILVILFPFVWVLWILPRTQSYWNMWWEKFMKWVFFAPAAMFFIQLSVNATGALGGELTQNISGGTLAAINAQTKQMGVNDVFNFQFLLQFLAVVGLMFGSLIVGQMMGVHGASAAMGFARRQGKRAAGLAGAGARRVGMEVPGVRAGVSAVERIQEKMQLDTQSEKSGRRLQRTLADKGETVSQKQAKAYAKETARMSPQEEEEHLNKLMTKSPDDLTRHEKGVLAVGLAQRAAKTKMPKETIQESERERQAIKADATLSAEDMREQLEMSKQRTEQTAQRAKMTETERAAFESREFEEAKIEDEVRGVKVKEGVVVTDKEGKVVSRAKEEGWTEKEIMQRVQEQKRRKEVEEDLGEMSETGRYQYLAKEKVGAEEDMVKDYQRKKKMREMKEKMDAGTATNEQKQSDNATQQNQPRIVLTDARGNVQNDPNSQNNAPRGRENRKPPDKDSGGDDDDDDGGGGTSGGGGSPAPRGGGGGTPLISPQSPTIPPGGGDFRSESEISNLYDTASPTEGADQSAKDLADIIPAADDEDVDAMLKKFPELLKDPEVIKGAQNYGLSSKYLEQPGHKEQTGETTQNTNQVQTQSVFSKIKDSISGYAQKTAATTRVKALKLKRAAGKQLSQDEFDELLSLNFQEQVEDNPGITGADGDNKVFSPAEELAKIRKLPKEQKKEAMAAYKENLAKQREGLARCRTFIERSVEFNPDVPREKLVGLVDKFGSTYGFSDEQKKIAEGLIDGYYAEHKKVLDLRQQIPDDEQLVRTLRGLDTTKRGGLNISKVSVGPMSIDIDTDQDTLQKLYMRDEGTQSSIGRQLLGQQFRAAGFAGSYYDNNGNRVNHTAIDASKMSAALSLSGTKSTKTHEYEHQKNKLYQQIFDNKADEIEKENEAIEKLKAQISAEQDPEIRKELGVSIAERYATRARRGALVRAKNELTAYFSEGKVLTSGLGNITSSLMSKEGDTKKENPYDYLKSTRKWATKIQDPASQKRATQILTEEYNLIIKSASDSLIMLQKEGGYSNHECNALLMDKPLQDWPKTVKRLLAEKNKPAD